MADEKWNVETYPPYKRVDARTRNQNIDDGKKLCVRCEGTGNESYSKYTECEDCNGNGFKDEDAEGKKK